MESIEALITPGMRYQHRVTCVAADTLTDLYAFLCLTATKWEFHCMVDQEASYRWHDKVITTKSHRFSTLLTALGG